MIYADTSALLKRYLHEAHSDEFDSLFLDSAPLSISHLSVLEARCALARRRRSGMIDASIETAAWRALQSDIRHAALKLHTVSDAQCADATDLIESLPGIALRSLDAAHLAIARDIGATALATADKTQADAAQALGFTVHRFF